MGHLSILELGRVKEGGTRQQALNEARDLARAAEALGYRRIWVAEHHNMAGVTTAATSLVIMHLAQATGRIRIGAGGIMLPNHAPYLIAEQFGTLATLFPGRIDLGLGRAPGTDQFTLRALRRDPGSSDRFPQDVIELQSYLGPVRPGQRIEAVPGSDTRVPLWILGSSLFGARLAGELGLPYGFASHFAPQALEPALDLYRKSFVPSEQLEAPYVMVGVNVIAAPTDDEARYLASSQEASFINLIRGERTLLPPPIKNIAAYGMPHEWQHANQMLSCRVVGSEQTVQAGLRELFDRTGADELIVVSDLYDFPSRLRSFELIAKAAELPSEIA